MPGMLAQEVIVLADRQTELKHNATVEARDGALVLLLDCAKFKQQRVPRSAL
jgi:hypothetical protein